MPVTMWRSECVWVSKWAGGAHATAAVLHIPHCSMLSSSIQHGLFFKLWISKDPQLCSSKQIRKDIKEIRHGKEGPGNRKPNAELFPAGITAIWKKLPRWWILPSICSRTKLYQTHSGGGQILREGGKKKAATPAWTWTFGVSFASWNEATVIIQTLHSPLGFLPSQVTFVALT